MEAVVKQSLRLILVSLLITGVSANAAGMEPSFDLQAVHLQVDALLQHENAVKGDDGLADLAISIYHAAAIGSGNEKTSTQVRTNEWGRFSTLEEKPLSFKSPQVVFHLPRQRFQLDTMFFSTPGMFVYDLDSDPDADLVGYNVFSAPAFPLPLPSVDPVLVHQDSIWNVSTDYAGEGNGGRSEKSGKVWIAAIPGTQRSLIRGLLTDFGALPPKAASQPPLNILYLFYVLSEGNREIGPATSERLSIELSARYQTLIQMFIDRSESNMPETTPMFSARLGQRSLVDSSDTTRTTPEIEVPKSDQQDVVVKATMNQGSEALIFVFVN